MTSPSPVISVILPVYNAERTVGAAVNSVLLQTFKDFELLIVNDGSTDDSVKVVRKFRDPRVRIIDHQVNRGLVTVLNHALQEARAELIARQDSDDVSMPERFELQRATLDAEPELGAIGATLRLLVVDGSPAGTWEYPEIAAAARWQALFKTPVAHSAVMFRRPPVLEVGGYSDHCKYAEDYDLWSRLLKVADIRSLPLPLVNYALSPHGVSRTKSLQQRAVQRQIAARNMAELLGREVPDDVVDRIAIGVDLHEGRLMYDQFIESARTCTALFNAFARVENGRSRCTAVLLDFRERLFKLARMLPYKQRLRAMTELRSMLPKEKIGSVAAVLQCLQTLNPIR